MNDLEITWKWEVTAPLHIGNGFSRAGFADRLVRIDKKGHAVIPSDAVKGAIRGSAEQLARWLGLQEEEKEETSYPKLPVLRRIFAPTETSSFYRFPGCVSEQAVAAYTFTSTKIHPTNRSAEDNTLRTIELLPSGMTFAGKVQLLAGDWSDVSKPDHKDLCFLLVAISSTAGIGGKKGNGLGKLQCKELRVNGVSYSDLLTKLETIQLLRKLVVEKE